MLTIRTGRGAGARWRSALAAACMLLVSGERVMAQQDREVTVDPSVFTLPEEDAEDDVAPRLVKPAVPRPLTAADLPPSNPLIASSSYWRTNVAFGRDWHAGRDEYRGLVERESRAFGLPPALVDAVVTVESGYNSASVGLDGEVGLMQVMLPTARMLGFTGTPAELAAPEINVHYGAKYLAGAWRLAGGDLCTAVMKYRAGHGETRFSYLSVNYCARVRGHLAARGVPVSGPLPQPTFGSASGVRARGKSISAGGNVNLVELNTRLRALTARKPPQTSN